MNRSQEYVEILDKSKDFQEIFSLVKKAVKKIVNEARVGLMLVLASLPERIGAYHEIGSNSIVLNRRLLGAVIRSGKTFREINSYIFTILLHEYLHSLGYLNEDEVKQLCYLVAKKNFGANHHTTNIVQSPMSVLNKFQLSLQSFIIDSKKVELIKDFEEPDQKYII